MKVVIIVAKDLKKTMDYIFYLQYKVHQYPCHSVLEHGPHRHSGIRGGWMRWMATDLSQEYYHKVTSIRSFIPVNKIRIFESYLARSGPQLFHQANWLSSCSQVKSDLDPNGTPGNRTSWQDTWERSKLTRQPVKKKKTLIHMGKEQVKKTTRKNPYDLLSQKCWHQRNTFWRNKLSSSSW